MKNHTNEMYTGLTAELLIDPEVSNRSMGESRQKDFDKEEANIKEELSGVAS